MIPPDIPCSTSSTVPPAAAAVATAVTQQGAGNLLSCSAALPPLSFLFLWRIRSGQTSSCFSPLSAQCAFIIENEQR